MINTLMVVREVARKCKFMLLILMQLLDDDPPANIRRRVWTFLALVEIVGPLLKKWNIPNNIGAIDRKWILIQKTPNAGSPFHDYKGNELRVPLCRCRHQREELRQTRTSMVLTKEAFGQPRQSA